MSTGPPSSWSDDSGVGTGDTDRVTQPTPPRWRTALWRGETAPIPVVRTPTRAVYPQRRPSDDTELAAVDQGVSVALRVGTLLLAGGAPTEDVEAAIFAVGTAVGLGTFEVDITYGSIVISVAPGDERPGLTDMRVVRGRSTHYARVAAAHRLVLDLAEGRLPPGDVEPRLREIEHLRRPYPRWFVVTAFGALSAAITIMLGGNALTAAIAFATSGTTGFIGNLYVTGQGWKVYSVKTKRGWLDWYRYTTDDRRFNFFAVRALSVSRPQGFAQDGC